MRNVFFKLKSLTQYCGLILLCSCLLSAYTVAEEDGTSTTSYKFKRIKNSNFNFYALKSTDVLKKYSKILYFPISTKSLLLKKSGDSDIDRSWKSAKPEDWLKITSTLDGMAQKYFPADNLFGLTDKSGADVLAVQVKLVEYTPRVSRNGELGGVTVGDQEVRSYGELLVIVMLVDSTTNETIGLASEGLSLGSGDLKARTSSRSSQMNGWQMAYGNLLKKLRDQLEAAHNI